jgi:hypothetical protein
MGLSNISKENFMLENVRKQINNLQVQDLVLQGLDLDNKHGVMYRNSRLAGQAKTDLCNIFKLQYGALAVAKKDETELAKQWKDFSAAVAKFRGKTSLRVVMNRETGDVERVLVPKKNEANRIDFDTQLEFIEKHVGQGHDLQQCYFDVTKLNLHALLIDPSAEIDVVKSDTWKLGFSLNLGRDAGWYGPAFLRQVCTNGMMATHQGWRKYLANFQTLLGRTLRFDDSTVRSTLLKKTRALASNHATVGEMVDIRKECDAEKFDRHFKIDGIDRAYGKYTDGKPVLSMDRAWQSMADAGVNAYDLFNYATAEASHNKSLDGKGRQALNIAASNYFFKGPRLGSIPPNPFRSAEGRKGH